ncbi:MAG: head GIN domain-containing protein [Anaerolineaceae bacterium]|jgi:hypothetical protein
MNIQSNSKLVYAILVVVLAAAFIAGCAQTPAVPEGTIVGSGKVINETREVSGFTSVTFSAPGYLTITQGDAESLTIQAEDNIIPAITTSVTDGVLDIALTDGTKLQNSSMIQYTLVVKDLSAIQNDGAGFVTVNGLTTKDFAFKSSNAGSAKLAGIEAAALTIDLTGAGTFEISGTADSLALTSSGSTVFTGDKLAVKTAAVTISGTGDATVNASETLEANLSGDGNLKYAGTPKLTENATGAGKISALD